MTIQAFKLIAPPREQSPDARPLNDGRLDHGRTFEHTYTQLRETPTRDQSHLVEKPRDIQDRFKDHADKVKGRNIREARDRGEDEAPRTDDRTTVERRDASESRAVDEPAESRDDVEVRDRKVDSSNASGDDAAREAGTSDASGAAESAPVSDDAKDETVDEEAEAAERVEQTLEAFMKALQETPVGSVPAAQAGEANAEGKANAKTSTDAAAQARTVATNAASGGTEQQAAVQTNQARVVAVQPTAGESQGVVSGSQTPGATGGGEQNGGMTGQSQDGGSSQTGGQSNANQSAAPRVTVDMTSVTAMNTTTTETTSSSSQNGANAAATALSAGNTPTASNGPVSSFAPPGAMGPPLPDSMQGDANLNAARVGRALQSAINQNGGTVMLRLQPAELGMVRVQMSIQNGVVQAQLQAETPEARNMLTQQLSQLRDALQSQGLTVERLQVQSPNSSQDANLTNQDQQQSGNQGSADSRSRGYAQQENRDQPESGQQRATSFSDQLEQTVES